MLREAVLLRDWEDLPYTALAEITDCPVGTVKGRVRLARARLREALTNYNPP
jgi:DNA-directed RNA polymerase specialized sigma24 family protein